MMGLQDPTVELGVRGLGCFLGQMEDGEAM